jgi:hypothetical protein
LLHGVGQGTHVGMDHGVEAPLEVIELGLDRGEEIRAGHTHALA